jgi:MFS family permease
VLLLVAVGAITSTVRWLELLAVGLFVFDRTGSAFLVASMTLLRMLPLAIFGAFAGALAERTRRTPVLRVTMVALAVLAAVLAVLAARDALAVWLMAVAAFASGVFWAMDNAFRRTIISDMVPPARLARAIALDVLANNGSRMVGPLLGGVLVQASGVTGAFALAALLYLLCLALLSLVRHQDEARRSHGGMLARLAEGLRYLRGHRTLTGVMAVTVIYNVFGFPFLSMVPVIGREGLQLSASAIGLLASIEGVGVLLGAVSLMLWLPERHYRRMYFYAVVLHQIAALVFAQSAWVALCAAALLSAGLAGAAFSAMQSTLVMLCAEPAARTRMMGVLSVCIGTGPVGFLHLGWLAEHLGAPWAVTVLALEGLLALWLTARVWPELLARQPESA